MRVGPWRVVGGLAALSALSILQGIVDFALPAVGIGGYFAFMRSVGNAFGLSAAGLAALAAIETTGA